MKKWSLSDVVVNAWHSEKRATRPRDVIWASEMGKPAFDRYHKMKGVEPTNEPTSRAHFKFFLGDSIESAILMVLERAGFTVEAQKDKEKCRIFEPGLLPVEGRFDAILSADGSWDDAMMRIKSEPLTHTMPLFQAQLAYIDKYAWTVASYCRDKFPDGLKRQVFEIKTINSMMLKSRMNKGTMDRDYYHYHLQLYTYLRYLKMDEGTIFFVSKDDGIFHIENIRVTPQLEKDWLEDVKVMTDIMDKDIVPEFPPFYYLQDGKYKVNYNAVGSSYLTLHTGKDLEEVQREVESQVRRLNYAIKKQQKELNA